MSISRLDQVIGTKRSTGVDCAIPENMANRSLVLVHVEAKYLHL